MRAQGNNSAERLRAIGERVGLPAHSRSYNYILMANQLSQILSRIEVWNPDNDNAQALYDDAVDADTTNLMLTIINHWSAATGRNLKEFVGSPGQYVQESSFAMSRSITPGGNGYRSLAKVK